MTSLIIASSGSDLWAAVQAIGGLFGLLVAIAVPAVLELLRRNAETSALTERRRAAFRAMKTVITALEERPQVRHGEIQAIGKVLDQIDFAILPARAASTFVNLRAYVATAGAIVDRAQAQFVQQITDNPFDVVQANAELEAIRTDFGMIE